jgi:hypothetical protein
MYGYEMVVHSGSIQHLSEDNPLPVGVGMVVDGLITEQI